MPNRLPAEKPSRENAITTMTAIRTMIAESAVSYTHLTLPTN